MLFKSIQSIQSINNIQSSVNNKVASNLTVSNQSSNNVALLGLNVDLRPLANIVINI